MPGLVILDLDGVIIKGQSQKLFLDYAFKKGLVGLFFYLKVCLWFIFYKFGLARSPQKIMDYAFSFLRGRQVSEIERTVGDFFNKIAQKCISPEIIVIINEHKEKNRELLIVSNSADIFVKKIADYLGIKNYISTRLEISGGKFTGRILGDIVFGKNKTDFVKEFLNKNNLSFKGSYAYADHISDLSLLAAAENPCAVNPDRPLFYEAKKRNWPIINTKNKK